MECRLAKRVAAVANPNSKDPDRPLAAHGTIAGAKELAAKLHETYSKHEMMALDLRSKSDRPDRLPYRQLEKAGAELYQARRDAAHLTLMGEPVGKDLDFKLILVDTELAKLMGAYRNTLPGGQRFQKNVAELRKKKPSYDKRIGQIVEAVKKGRSLEQAEQELERIGMEIRGLTYMFRPLERTPYAKAVNSAISELEQKLGPLRKSQYADEAKSVIAKNQRAVSQFASEAARLRTEMVTGKVVIGEVTDAGAPEAIAHLANEWGKASAALIRSTAILWAFTGGAPSKVNTAQMARVSQLNKAAIDAIIAVIDAATISATPESIPQLHADIMHELSYLDHRTIGSGISKDCQPALTRLAQKSPTLPAQIAAYDRATRQPLIWRERFARQSVESLRTSYPNSGGLFSAKTAPTATNKPEMYGRLSKTQRVLLAKTIGGGASWRVFEASTTTLGRLVSKANTLRLYPGSLTALVRHRNMHYSNVAIGMPIQRHIDDLKESLLIDDQFPALNFAAVDAIASAEREDYEDHRWRHQSLASGIRFDAVHCVTRRRVSVGTTGTIAIHLG